MSPSQVIGWALAALIVIIVIIILIGLARDTNDVDAAAATLRLTFDRFRS